MQCELVEAVCGDLILAGSDPGVDLRAVHSGGVQFQLDHGTGRHQGPLEIGEKIRAPSAPFDARAKRQVESQVGVSE